MDLVNPVNLVILTENVELLLTKDSVQEIVLLSNVINEDTKKSKYKEETVVNDRRKWSYILLSLLHLALMKLNFLICFFGPFEPRKGPSILINRLHRQF